MNKQEIEELKIGVNRRLEKSKYKDSYVEVFGSVDVMQYIEWTLDRMTNDSVLISEKLENHPSLLDWSKSESDSIGILFGEFIKSNQIPSLEISISYNGKNISGGRVPACFISKNINYLESYFRPIAESAAIFTQKYIFSAILDDECDNNKYWKSYITGIFSKLKDIKQIAARIEMSAALFGDKLVDQALEKCGVMNLKELRYAAED